MKFNAVLSALLASLAQVSAAPLAASEASSNTTTTTLAMAAAAPPTTGYKSVAYFVNWCAINPELNSSSDNSDL